MFIELSWCLSDHGEKGIVGKGWLNPTRGEGSKRKKKQDNGNRRGGENSTVVLSPSFRILYYSNKSEISQEAILLFIIVKTVA